MYSWQTGSWSRSIRHIHSPPISLKNADLDNDRYLYCFGEYITENELGTARHLRTLPEETLRKMADVYTEGYRIGFINTGIRICRKNLW